MADNPIHRFALSVSRFMALIGGIVLTLLIILVCVSVIGRALNTLLHGPIDNLFPEFAAAALALGLSLIHI